MPKLLFLSSQFSGYFYDCLKELVKLHHFEVQVIRWQSTANTPYQFLNYQGISIKLKDKSTKKELLQECLSFQPDIVYFPGWMDKDYLKIVGKLRRKGVTSIMGFDNQWRGTVKQTLLTFMGYQVFKRLFKADYVWVAGEPQMKYIKRIGFPETHILHGLYSANQSVFFEKYEHFKTTKNTKFLRKFLYVGRFERVKNVRMLYEVFKNITEENLHLNWSLTMVGEGPEGEYLKPNKNIEIRRFMQPDELTTFMSQFDCFILPSLHEPWGVVVHEAVSSGLPLILSSVIGAGTIFLKEGENGFSFEATNEKDLKDTILRIINLTDETLMKMSLHSVNLSHQITPTIWCNTLNSILAKSL